MNRVIALARVTFLDGLRRNAVWGLCLFALLFEVCGTLFMDFFGRGLGRVICDFQFSIMWAAGMLFILFYAVQSIAWDDDHRTIDSILARPISRTEYVLGIMAGLVLLLLCFEGLLGGIALAEILWIKPKIQEVYFPIFSIWHYLITWAALQLILIALLSVAMLISSAIRGAFPVMLMTLSYALICSGLPVVREMLGQQENISYQGLDNLLKGLNMVFPDYSILDLKNTVVSNESLSVIIGMSPSLPFMMVMIYIVIILFLTCFIYQRRDIL